VKLGIDRNVCDGHGMCAQSAPDFVRLDDDGEPVVIQEQVPAEVPPAVDLALRACPVSAVHLD
jgi:ferredoxin